MDLVRLCALCLVGLTLFPAASASPRLLAADAVAEGPLDSTDVPPAANPGARFKLQVGDEEPIPADPIRPEDSAHKSRRSAITWQLAGQLHLSNAETDKAELKTAENCFRQAIKADPGFLRSYQLLVGLLLSPPVSEERIQDAKRVAFQAAEQSNEGFTLIRQLAGLLARQQVERGVTTLTEALTIKSLVPQSVTYFQVQRDLGLFHRLGGNNEKAAECYKLVFDAVTKTDPALFNAEQLKEIMADPAALYEEMGQVFLSVKQPDLALNAFNKAADIRGSRSATHSYNLAQIFRETGKPAEGLEELQKYLDAQLQSKGRGAYELLKDLLTDLKRESELVERLEQLRSKDAQNTSLRYYLAEKYVDLKRFEEAEKAILNGQAEPPRDAFALVGLVPVYHGQKKYELLLGLLVNYKASRLPDPDQLKQVEGLEPDVKSLLERYGKDRDLVAKDSETMDGLVAFGKELMKGEEAKIQLGQAWVLGELCGMAERVDDAKTFYRQAIDMQNEPEFQFYSELGQILLDADRHEEAITIFKECANHPSSTLQEQRWRSLYLLSYASEFAGKTEEALAAANEARTEAEKAGLGEFAGALLHAQIGWVHYHAQEFDKAIGIYEEVLKKYPKTPQTEKTLENARFSLSAIYVLKGEMAQGEAILEQVLRDDPDNTQANNDLGYLWADQGKNLEQALAMIGKALAAEPDNAAYLDSLGWVLFKLGKTEEAVQKLEQACGMKRGDDPTLNEHLGDCYAKLGRTDDAQKTWTKALELMEKKKSKDSKLRKSLRGKLGLPAE